MRPYKIPPNSAVSENDVFSQVLVGSRKIRELIAAPPKMHLTVKIDEGWFSARFPNGVDELYFRVGGVINDVERLKAPYKVLAEVLDQLWRIGSAYERNPQVTL